MKSIGYNQRAAFAMLALIACVAAVALMVTVILPRLAKPKNCGASHCINNLRQVSIGFRLYASDGEDYPVYNPTNQAWNYFQTVGKEIGRPQVLSCNYDSRWATNSPARDFDDPPGISSFGTLGFQNAALSYFYGVDSTEDKPDLILAGDRNLTIRQKAMPGLLILNSNSPVRWTSETHTNC